MSSALHILGAPWRILGPVHALLLALATVLWLGGCMATSGGPPTPNAIMSATYSALGTLDEQIGQAAYAGRLKAAKASALLDESERIRRQLGDARALLRGCAGQIPCEPFDASLRGINERLAEMQCRRRQAEAGQPEDACKLPPAAAPAPTGSKP